MRRFEPVAEPFRRHDEVRLPLRATARSVGYDFFAP